MPGPGSSVPTERSRANVLPSRSRPHRAFPYVESGVSGAGRLAKSDLTRHNRRAMPEAIVGRDAELATIEGFVAKLGESPRALVIAGEPGIGKTTLWQSTVDAARQRGATTLETRPLQADARRSFTGLADLMRNVHPSLISALPAPQALAIDVVCQRVEPTRAGVDHRVIAAG